MKGEEALWMPGTDHAGIATQNVVERSLAKEGLKRQDLGRDEFLRRVWQWRQQYGSTIIRQLKKIGASCDWSRTRFTMDEDYSEAVLEVFIRLYQKGLIYRSSYIINWCPRCQTALSDEETPHKTIEGNLYYLRYPFAGEPDKFVVVATTRPETMLGDTAVAVNPGDKRYKRLIGKFLVLPLVGRKIKIIADRMVDMKFGTGAVKVTPSHDINDYNLAIRHNLEFVNVMSPDGRMNDKAKKYENMDRFEARRLIVNDLKQLGLLEKVEPYQLSAGHCYRCNTIIEPYLSTQWFVRMKPLAKPAIEAVKKGKIKFYPSRWTKVYLNWMENIRDWCISRQIWWGHRLPVYYCNDCLKENDVSQITELKPNLKPKKEKGVIVSRLRPRECPYCGSTAITQDEDVLDTWFSSWLWPFATFHWPFNSDNQEFASQAKKDLEYFYPTSVLVTAPEIIFFWVARMIMAGFEFMGKEPFRAVYIHGTVRDVEGRKMSKSLGNIIDPLDIINEYGADALRFSLISITATGQDVFLSKERFEQGRNFTNKVWNASRFVLTNLAGGDYLCESEVKLKKEDLKIIDRWMLSRFNSFLKMVSQDLEELRFNEAAQLVYSFFWHEFCDWYLEAIKGELADSKTQRVMVIILEKLLRVIHPFMPFITEELWQRLGGFCRAAELPKSIMIEDWPKVNEDFVDVQLEQDIQLLWDMVTTIRNMRLELDLPLKDELRQVVIYATQPHRQHLLLETSAYIKRLANVSSVVVDDRYLPKPNQYVSLFKDMHIVIPLEGTVDILDFSRRLTERIDRIEKEIVGKKRLLENSDFARKAPVEVVEREKEKLRELQEALSKLKVVQDGIR